MISLSYDWLSLQAPTSFAKMAEKSIYKPVSKCCKNGKYHGCWSIYEDGTRMLISKNLRCKHATDDPFWKEPKDVDFKIKTRTQKRKMNKPAMKDVVKYLTKEISDEDHEHFQIKPNDYIVNFLTAW